jgi:multidrug efflux pump subunit AcrA (membrane-fusion protein)
MQGVTEYVELTGNAAAVNTVKLIARVDGYLEQIHFADGAIVKEGDLLFTIQQDQYKAQLVQAEAQVQAQKAALFLAKTEVALYGAAKERCRRASGRRQLEFSSEKVGGRSCVGTGPS